jgi:hypothetical protein
MKSDLYNIIYDKLKDESEKILYILEYEIQKSINEKVAVDMETLTSGFKMDFEDDNLIIIEGKTYTQAKYLETILEVIKDLIKE